MKHTLLALLIVGSASLSSGSTAFADEHESGTDVEHSRDGRMSKHMRGAERSERMLEKVDSNKDGQVDLSEYLAHAEQRFNKMDLNSDGYLTLEEGKEMHEKMRAKHKEMRAKHKELRKKHREEHKELRRKQSEELKDESTS